VCDYVHLNPVRARLLTAEQSLRNYFWSSYGSYLKPPSQRPPWLRVDRLLGEMSIPRDTAAGRRQFEQRMEERRAQETSEDWRALRRGWCLGDEAFRKELLAQAHQRTGEYHYGLQRRESAEDKAERIVKEEMAQR